MSKPPRWRESPLGGFAIGLFHEAVKLLPKKFTMHVILGAMGNTLLHTKIRILFSCQVYQKNSMFRQLTDFDLLC